MKLERINTAKGFCAKRSQRIPELHRNTDIVKETFEPEKFKNFSIVPSCFFNSAFAFFFPKKAPLSLTRFIFKF